MSSGQYFKSEIFPPPKHFSISASICKIISPIDSAARSKRRFLRAGEAPGGGVKKSISDMKILAGARTLFEMYALFNSVFDLFVLLK